MRGSSVQMVKRAVYATEWPQRERKPQVMSYETDEYLKSFLDTNQLAREQMCLAVLAIDRRFTDVKPRHPRGGRDGGRDIEALFQATLKVFGAVGFVNQANDSEDQKNRIKSKFDEDITAARKNDPEFQMFVFFTNINLTIGEKEQLVDTAAKRGLRRTEIYDRERIRIVLDSPDGLSIRYQYLQIPLSEAEQATFFARWGDDIQSVISDGFGRLGKALNRLTFLAETQLPLEGLTVLLDLDREYTAPEIQHFRAFCSLWLVEEKAGFNHCIFGSADNTSRLDANSEKQLNLEQSGISKAICGAQWEVHTEKDSNSAEYQKGFRQTGSSKSVGRDKIQQIAIRYHGANDFMRITPYLLLRDLDLAKFVFYMNGSLFEKLDSIAVYANEYKLAHLRKDALRAEPRNPDIPMLFTNDELADAWVVVRPPRSSLFELRFSETTPTRFFAAEEIEE